MDNPHERLRKGFGETNFGFPNGVAGAAPLQRLTNANTAISSTPPP